MVTFFHLLNLVITRCHQNIWYLLFVISFVQRVKPKVRKRWHQNPLFGHIGDKISKNRNKKYTGLRGKHETQFSSKFGAKLSLPYPFFSWTPSSKHCCSTCAVGINVLERGAFNPESQYFIPLFNKILQTTIKRGWNIKWGVQLRLNRAWLYG